MYLTTAENPDQFGIFSINSMRFLVSETLVVDSGFYMIHALDE